MRELSDPGIAGLRGGGGDLARPAAPFVTDSRAATDMHMARKLVARFTGGMGSNRYLQNDYQQLEHIKAAHEAQGARQLAKLRQLNRVRRANKDINAIKTHRLVWRQHLSRLGEAARRLQTELTDHMEQSEDDEWAELRAYGAFLQEDLTQFTRDTLAMVAEARNDVEALYADRCDAVDEQFELVGQRLEEVRAHIDSVGVELSASADLLTLDLDTDDPRPPMEDPCCSAMEGIPADLLLAHHPGDEELWTSLMTEVVLLDELFLQRLRDLDVSCADTLCDARGGWGEAEHTEFTLIVDQYPRDMPNSHTFLLDRLRRHFPEKSQQQLLEHETWCRQSHAHHTRRQGLLLTWQQHKAQLCLKIKAAFADALARLEDSRRTSALHQSQRQYCQQLLHKVSEWREQKAEEERLQAELSALEDARRAAAEHVRSERTRQMRDIQKGEIEHYRGRRKAERERAEVEKRKQLAELRARMEEQGRLDAERVKYRAEQERAKEQRRAEQRQRQEAERAELEARLEGLRAQVRIEAERDESRLKQHTLASEARVNAAAADHSHQPVTSDLHTWSAEQVAGDSRVRAEQALRSAGLLNTDYARQVISTLPPPVKPRPDTQSTLKFGTE